jgi:predicted phosphoribosyltransferase
VPVGQEVAVELGVPLDVLSVRKLGVPGHEELAFGAIATGGVRVLNRDVVFSLGSEAEEIISMVSAKELEELKQRESLFRGGHGPLDVHGKTVLLVDDGLATGATMRAAFQALRHLYAARIVVAVPVGPPDTCAVLEAEADRVVCPLQPRGFMSVGQYYDVFDQTSNEEVRAILAAQLTRHSVEHR